MNSGDFLFRNSKWFLQCQHFPRRGAIHWGFPFFGIMYKYLAILVAFEPRGFKKTYIQFPKNKFAVDTVIINLGGYILEI